MLSKVLRILLTRGWACYELRAYEEKNVYIQDIMEFLIKLLCLNETRFSTETFQFDSAIDRACYR